MDVRGHFIAVTFFQFGDERIALEQRITLLVDLKLFKTQIGNTVGHILQLVRRR